MQKKNKKVKYIHQIVLYAEGENGSSAKVLALLRHGCFALLYFHSGGEKVDSYEMDQENTISFLNSLPYKLEVFQLNSPADLTGQNRFLNNMTVALMQTILETFSGTDAIARWKDYCDTHGFTYSTYIDE